MGAVKVKICGLTSVKGVDAAVEAGASYIGFVFFSRSPRNVEIALADELSRAVPKEIRRVAVTVDATDPVLDEIHRCVGIDMFQLHGDESPDRVADIRDAFGFPVMKAIGVSDRTDLESVAEYAEVADQLLVDASPRDRMELPGGNGLGFDWNLVKGRHWPIPWMLAGGLTVGNVAEAVRLTGARQVDVSSGVERAPGVKDDELIKTFVSSAHSTCRPSPAPCPRPDAADMERP